VFYFRHARLMQLDHIQELHRRTYGPRSGVARHGDVP
jgi:hypothetical protein